MFYLKSSKQRAQASTPLELEAMEKVTSMASNIWLTTTPCKHIHIHAHIYLPRIATLIPNLSDQQKDTKSPRAASHITSLKPNPAQDPQNHHATRSQGAHNAPTQQSSQERQKEASREERTSTKCPAQTPKQPPQTTQQSHPRALTSS